MIYPLFQIMASSSKDNERPGTSGEGRKKPSVAKKRLPFLRAGEEKNISPSKFEKVLHYFSDSEISDFDVFEEDEDEEEEETTIDPACRVIRDIPIHESGEEYVVGTSDEEEDEEEEDSLMMYEDEEEAEARGRKRKRTSTRGKGASRGKGKARGRGSSAEGGGSGERGGHVAVVGEKRGRGGKGSRGGKDSRGVGVVEGVSVAVVDGAVGGEREVEGREGLMW